MARKPSGDRHAIPEGEAAKERRVIDWEAIEREYRAGQLTVREIGAAQGISHVAVLKRAKRDGWERDLSAAVREKVTARLVTDGVTKAVTAREAVEIAAERGVQIVREHRAIIGRARAVADKMLGELEAPDVDGSLKDRSSVLVNLSNSTKTLVGLERQAFGLEAEQPAGIAAIYGRIERVIVDATNAQHSDS
jgi:hypothetical protein